MVTLYGRLAIGRKGRWPQGPAPGALRRRKAPCDRTERGRALRYPSSSIDLGQLAFKRRDRARSARMTPRVWQRAQ
jgi:hypothetical protein